MKGRKKNPVGNVIPMKGDQRPVVDPPLTLTETARGVWEELAPMLARMSRLEPHYRYQFASYCEAVATFLKSTNEIEMGAGRWYAVKTRNGVQQKKTAAFNLQGEAMNQMRRDAALFGLSPVDEARLDTGSQGDLFKEVMESLKGKPSASD